MAVTRNLNQYNIICDNYCLKCGEPKEFVIHAIFECSHALQAWSLSATPTNPEIFSVPSSYANLDYLFWRKNNIVESTLHKDLYLWIIWYIWKIWNNKPFMGIDKDQLELVRYACQIWFNANKMIVWEIFKLWGHQTT